MITTNAKAGFLYSENQRAMKQFEKEKYAKRMETAVVLETTYKIRSGDNLWDIAKKKGTTVTAIRKANPNKNLNVLKIGQVINIPVR